MDSYLCITIDTECDRSPDWSTSNPLTFKSVLHAVPELLQPLFDEFRAIPTYLLTNEVLENKECVRTMAELAGQFELGTHLHADYLEPQRRFTHYPGTLCDDFQTDYSPDVERAKLQNLTNLFKNAFGRDPKLFRAGRFAANENTIRSLIQLGYQVDTSVTPHMVWKNRYGKELSFLGAPSQPYFPSDADISKRGFGRLLEVPVTIAPRFDLRSSVKNLRPVMTNCWLRPFWSSTQVMKKLIDSVNKNDEHGHPRVLNMMFHSMELVANASPYTQSAEDIRRYMQSIRDILGYCRDTGVQFAGLEGIYALFV